MFAITVVLRLVSLVNHRIGWTEFLSLGHCDFPL